MENLPTIEKSSGQSGKNKSWIFVVAGIAVIIVLVAFAAIKIKNGGFGMSGKAVAEQVVDYLNAEAPSEVTLKSVSSVSGVYKIDVLFQGQTVTLYATKDGKYFGNLQPLIDAGDSNPQFVDVSEDDDAAQGKSDAPVTIIEFSDYQCPFCRKFWTDTYPQLKKNYIDTGKVKLVFRDFPLSFHPMAEPSARAAECVREKGGDAAYWKFHDKMFSEQNKLDGGTVKSTITYTESDLKNWAKAIGYDIASCLDSGKYADEVAQDMVDGQSYGVSGTPAFFVNGQLLSGALPYAQFQQAIEAALAQAA
jgi:protein-disulfide isomerase